MKVRKSLEKDLKNSVDTLEQIIDTLLKFSEVKARFLNYEKEIYELLNVAIRLINADGVSILTYESDKMRFKYVISKYRRKLLQLEIPSGQGVAYRCFERQEPIILKEAKKSKYHFSEIDKIIGYSTENILALPLSTPGRRIGVIEFVNIANIEELYTEELKLLQIFANRFCELLLIYETYNELQQTRELIDREKNKYTNIIDNLAIGLLALDEEEKGLFLNKAGESLLGLNRFDMVNEHIKNLIAPEYLPLLQPLFEDDRQSHGKVKEVKIYTSTGEVRIFNITPYWLYDTEGNFVLKYITFSDVTDYLRYRELGAWREMARYLAHELKNPLTPIRIYAEMLSKNTDSIDYAFLRKYSKMLIEQVNRMNSLIESFHEFAKIDDVQFKRKNLLRTIRNVIDMYSAYEDVKIELNANRQKVILYFDPDKMSQVFINLIKNSIEALDGRGKISIDVRRESSRVLIDYKDTGPGVPEEYRERLFLPQFTTKKTGSGLGLALVSRILALHNGSIRYDSGYKGGARFVIELKI